LYAETTPEARRTAATETFIFCLYIIILYTVNDDGNKSIESITTIITTSFQQQYTIVIAFVRLVALLHSP
jgi:hypothetical protein